MPRRSTSRRTIRPFATLPRHRRRSLVIGLQGRMLRNAHYTGSTLFDSHHLLIDPEEPNRLRTCVDVVFPGLDRFTRWNAAFITTEMANSDLASEQAHHQMNARLAAANETYEIRLDIAFDSTQKSRRAAHVLHGVCPRKTLRLFGRSDLFTGPRGFGIVTDAEPSLAA